ncbi:MAG: uncharacterized protein QOH56_1494 [Pseudonocardiales bacterium]|nr:uncharacterized protein [Pseudonocardiales bacterium]MDT4915385.1 uncharacterized protein [Pseudonocardiales bacterium]
MNGNSPDSAGDIPIAGTPGTRDRDRAGRARSGRPRDGLGRPLPYGVPGVQRAPEGVVRPPRESLETAQRLLDDGKPFHAHEVLEDAWKSAPDGERELWRGLAQLAVGLTHAARGNRAGAVSLLNRGAASIDPYAGEQVHGMDIGRIVAWSRALAAQLDSEAVAVPVPSLPRLALLSRAEDR